MRSLRIAAVAPLAAAGILAGVTAPAHAQSPAAVTVNRSATLNSDGTITVTGTYTCGLTTAATSAPTLAFQAADGRNITGQATQTEATASCPGTSQPYSVNITPGGGSWTRGDRIQLTVNFTNLATDGTTEQATTSGTVSTRPASWNDRRGSERRGHRGAPAHRGRENHAPHQHREQHQHGKQHSHRG